MRKVLFFTLILLSTASFSQAPQFLNYQGIARNGAGTIVTTPIGIKFEILQGSSVGTVVYEETHNITPSSAGVFTAAIGNGSIVMGSFPTINWANSPYFIRVSIDPTGGTSYSTVGTSQLLSVPYALYAESTKPSTLSISGNSLSISNGNSVTLPAGTSYTAGTGISITGNTITNTAPNPTLVAAGISSITGTSPTFTIDVPPPALNYNTGTQELTLTQGTVITTATITTSSTSVSITGTGVTGSYPNYTITPPPATSITAIGSSILVTGSDPNFTIVPTPSLNLIGNQLSIADGNTVTLPTGTTYTNGAGISLISGTIITNAAPDQVVAITGGTNVTVNSAYPNFTVNATPTLSLATNVLSISGGNSVILPSPPTPTAGPGISITSGTITNTAPDQIVTLGNGVNTNVNGSYPNFTVNSTPSLSIAGNTLSITGGTSVVLPAPPALTPSTGISIISGTITNTAPNQTVNVSGPGVIGTYPNYTVTATPATTVASGSPNVIVTGTAPSFTISATPPTIVGTGVTTVTNSVNNFTINTPPVNMTYNPLSGILSYSPSGASSTININPTIGFSGTTLTVGSGTTIIPGTGLWSRAGTQTYLNNMSDFVGIGTTNPAQNLHVEGVNALIRVQSTQSTTAANSMIEFGNTISTLFNAKGRIGNPGSGDHLEYDALTFHRFLNAGVERMRLTNAGELIIGNFTPFSQLDVSGKITMRSGAFAGYIPVSDGNGTMTWTNPSSVVPSLWSVSGNSLYPSTLNNFVGLGNTSPTAKLHLSGVNTSTFINAFSASPETALRIHNDDLTNNNFSSLIFSSITSGFANYEVAKILGVAPNHTSGSATGDLVFMTRSPANILERVRITSTGNVGIGTSTPVNLLHVNGAVTISDGTQGAGKVLTSDAIGNASWQALTPKIGFLAGNCATTDQSIPASVTNDVNFSSCGSRFFNDGAGYVTGTGRFTAPVSGTYQFNVHLLIGGTGGTNVQIVLRDAAGKIAEAREAISASGEVNIELPITVKLTSGSQIWVTAFGSGAINIRRYESTFSGHLIYQ